MLKRTDNLFDLLKIKDQKKELDDNIDYIIKTINLPHLDLNKDSFYIKNNIFKIKTSSNIRFTVLLKIEEINKKLSERNIILEL